MRSMKNAPRWLSTLRTLAQADSASVRKGHGIWTSAGGWIGSPAALEPLIALGYAEQYSDDPLLWRVTEAGFAKWAEWEPKEASRRKVKIEWRRAISEGRCPDCGETLTPRDESGHTACGACGFADVDQMMRAQWRRALRAKRAQ